MRYSEPDRRVCFKTMRFHDFHIAGYSVTDFGGTIVLDLVYDYPSRPKVESQIKFTEVAAYHFVHTGGAILTDIEQVSLEILLKRVGDSLAEQWQQHGGYIHWRDDRSEYQAILEKEGYKAWFLDSAVGFEGFVIAKAVEEIPKYDIA